MEMMQPQLWKGDGISRTQLAVMAGWLAPSQLLAYKLAALKDLLVAAVGEGPRPVIIFRIYGFRFFQHKALCFADKIESMTKKVAFITSSS